MTPVALPQLTETVLATQRYLEALTFLDEDDLRAPSVLPGWTRRHVVAHLTRNADALARMLRTVQAGGTGCMYASDESRDADIAATAAQDVGALRAECAAMCASFEEAASALDPRLYDATVSRTPDAPGFPVSRTGTMRRTEVEVHHADLDIGYLPRSWPTDFSVALIKRRQDELAASAQGGPSMVLSSTDVEGLWKLGPGPGPEISGTAGDLAWWLAGRGGGGGLVCSAGELPTLPRWR